MPLHQLNLIERVRRTCEHDHRVIAALMYGSFVKGEGDQFSDIEFWLFFSDDLLPQVTPEQWIDQIEPAYLVFANEFGTHVAFFKSLVRGEFHFVPASTMSQVRDWGGITFAAEDMIVVDRSGELLSHLKALEGRSPAPKTGAQVEELCGRYLNWLLFGVNVLKRGEVARAYAHLAEVSRYLLWMARLGAGSTTHWLPPWKNIEHDLPDAMPRYIRCTANAERVSLTDGYREAWHWGRELIGELEPKYGFRLPSELLTVIDESVGQLTES